MMMQYLDLEKHLSAISEQPGRSKEALSIKTAMEQFKGLRGFEHERQLRICGTEINPHCDKVELMFEDDKLIAMPYVQDKLTRLYSSPAAFYIGYNNPNGFGIVPYGDWQEHMVEHGIGKAAIKAAELYLKSRGVASY